MGNAQRDAERHFVDLHGVHWTVREVDARLVPGAPRPMCLLFESDTAARRVWDYPAYWRTVSEAELEVISWRR